MATSTRNARLITFGKALFIFTVIAIVALSYRNFSQLYALTQDFANVSTDYFQYPTWHTDETSRATKESAEKEETPTGPMNILILYPDDWRHDSIGSEKPFIQTPFLDQQLAKKGIRFTHNCVTTSICWISRATLFTGQYSSQHESVRLKCPYFSALPERWNASWPYLLRTLGNYTVGHVGKWQYHMNMRRHFDWSSFHEGRHWYNLGGRTVTAASRARMDAINFLKWRPKDRPFAMTVAFYPPKPVGSSTEPGAQWMPDDENRAIYENMTIDEPYNISMSEAFDTLPPFLRQSRTASRGRWEERYGTSHHYQESMKNYYALVTQVDGECRKIVEELTRQGVEKNTMIIFTTDNGMMHGSHGLAGKWYPYQESIRVPLIVYDPRMPLEKRGMVDDSFTLNIDLAKTILGAAGIDPPEVMDGRDISDLYLANKKEGVQQRTLEKEPWRDEFFYEFPDIFGRDIPPSTALVRKKWKYIHWPLEDYEQLFNLEDDPLELNDVWNETQYKSILREMREVHFGLRQNITKPNEPGKLPC